MFCEQLGDICLGPDQKISDAIACIDASGGEIALVTDEAGRLKGTITDGDIRRAILRGCTLESLAGDIMNSDPRVVVKGTRVAEIAARMRQEHVGQMPIVDGRGVVVDLVLAGEIFNPVPGKHPVVIMAGGLGTRLRPITESIPKPMVPIGGRPILEVIIEQFASQGFRWITLCVNHLAEVIEGHFGDGRAFGVDIEYVREAKRMGTAGALSLVSPTPSMPVIVMNGDVLTALNFGQLLAFHYENGALATMGVNHFQYEIPYGVVDIKNHNIHGFVEKPVFDFFVNAGLYVVSPQVFDCVPEGEFFDMPSLFDQLEPSQKMAFPIHEYWLDIGRHDDLDRASREYETVFGGRPNR